MASDPGHSEIPLKENEVLLYKDGNPVLKVEKETPLTVIKMLYNADPKNKGTVIAALRPRTDDPLPCLVTLDRSTLTQEKYDIIAFEQPKPTQRLSEYQMGQPILTMGPNGQVQTMIPAGWPVTTAGLTYGPVNQLLQNHAASHVNMTSASKTSLLHAGSPLAYASPVISNVISNANMGPVGALSQGGTFPNIVPRKSPLTLKPSATPSRRKRSGHKTAFPRKITLVVPDHVTESPGINVKKFLYPKPVRRSSRDVSEECRQTTDELNAVVVCDSTAGNENGRLSSDGTPSPPKDGRRPLIQAPNGHQRIIESSPNSSEQSGADEHAIYHGQRSDGSSPEHESSLEEEEGHPIMVDSDEKESFSAGNESDTGVTATQSGIVSVPDHLIYRGSDARVASVGETDREGLPITNRARDNAAHFSRSRYRSDDEDDAISQFPTTIVRLENTVRVKAEPLDGNSSPSSEISCNNFDTNGVTMVTSEGACGQSSNSSDNEHSNFLPSSSVRGLMEQDGITGIPPLHPGTPHMSTGVSTGISTNLTPYPPSYPRTTGDGVAFRCEQCQKEFDTSAALERHKRSHSGERPYKCKICGWGFNLSGNLNQHMAIHQKVKPFKCVYCGKTFARSNVLKAHVRCHTGERPYQCELCGAKFIIPHNLKKHLLNRHQVVWEERRWSAGKSES